MPKRCKKEGRSRVKIAIASGLLPLLGASAFALDEVLWERNALWEDSGATYFNGARCEAEGTARCPREMGWQGNEFTWMFSLPPDAAKTPDLRFELTVDLVLQPVVASVAAGPAGTSLVSVGTLPVEGPGIYRITISSGRFAPGGRNEIRLKGDNEVGFGEPSGIRWISAGLYRRYDEAPAASDEELLDDTQWRACRYFYEQSFPSGLVRDTLGSSAASMAATGFGLTVLTILSERAGSTPRWSISAASARARAEGILDAILAIQERQAEDEEIWGRAGIPYHFTDGEGRRARNSEVSTIDGALLLAGVLQAGERFGGSLQTKARAIFTNADFKPFYRPSRNRYSHGWRPESGWIPVDWDRPGDETLLVCLMALAGAPGDQDRLRACYGYPRVSESYSGIPVVRSYFGSLFTYTFAHFWIPFECLGGDRPGDAGVSGIPAVDWWGNSRRAVEANRRYHLDRLPAYPVLGKEAWGASACYRADGPEYFGANGAAPAEANPAFDGTLPPHGAIMSLFLAGKSGGEKLETNPAFQALRHYYRSRFSTLWCSYGPRSSFDASGNTSHVVVGIEKGPEALGIESYRTGRPGREFLAISEMNAAISLVFERHTCTARPVLFVRGRLNADEEIDVSDVVHLLGFLFLGGGAPSCVDAADINDDGALDISDPIRFLGFLFLGAAPPPIPFLAPGLDPTPDGLAPCVEED